MILFKLVHVWMILFGTKTVTRRRGKRRWKIGGIHWAQLNFKPSSRFARVEVLDVYEQALGDMTDADAQLEGYKNLKAFKKTWRKIYGPFRKKEVVWVVRFRVIEQAQPLPAAVLARRPRARA